MHTDWLSRLTKFTLSIHQFSNDLITIKRWMTLFCFKLISSIANIHFFLSKQQQIKKYTNFFLSFSTTQLLVTLQLFNIDSLYVTMTKIVYLCVAGWFWYFFRLHQYMGIVFVSFFDWRTNVIELCTLEMRKKYERDGCTTYSFIAHVWWQGKNAADMDNWWKRQHVWHRVSVRQNLHSHTHNRNHMMR